MVTLWKTKADLNAKWQKRLMIVSTEKQHIFFTIIKKIKIASVYEKQWEICKEEPKGTLNFRADFD